MKKTMIYAAAVLMVACGPAKVVQESQKDSVTTIVKDTTIYKDSIIYIRVEAEKDSVVIHDTDTSYLSTRYAESEAYVSKGRLHHSLKNISEALIPIEIKMPVTIHFESKESIKDKHAIEVVEVEKQLSKWQSFIMALGYAVLGAVVLWIIRTLVKILR
jgi:hypothetical protein